MNKKISFSQMILNLVAFVCFIVLIWSIVANISFKFTYEKNFQNPISVYETNKFNMINRVLTTFLVLYILFTIASISLNIYVSIILFKNKHAKLFLLSLASVLVSRIIGIFCGIILLLNKRLSTSKC
ncbi:hypothetical protein BRO50_00635 [Metamycoplasma hominis]|uniref:Uncharacterized protein n=2 Tax=Metamycoplasma hominis TaxID=2098 RepID=A0A2K9YT23_METHO|nr:hypothetical protein [Metamycoplasma hominis]AUW36962.1 hypothetical protein C1937_00605 [Metamycoplasma hominis]AYK04477.1 hypothetical protein D9D13_00615 [Metamycoplasma hominis]AYN65241.1 hypothetical protein KN71_000745 [Metamycoplasma hominis]MBD3898676.1 hypothetical protein [Metamycoplasma hominis]MCF1354731.1 hypothetical protein [Metamycoplasma hominis]